MKFFIMFRRPNEISLWNPSNPLPLHSFYPVGSEKEFARPDAWAHSPHTGMPTGNVAGRIDLRCAAAGNGFPQTARQPSASDKGLKGSTMSASSPSCLRDIDSNELLNRAIEAHYAEITAAVGRKGHSHAAARDIVHDLYVKLAARPDVLREKRSIRAFLCRAAINLGIDRFRREQFEARLFSGSEHEALAVPDQTATPDHRLEVEMRLALLREAIAELPKRRRAIFVLHRLHQLSPDDIGARLGISRNMVNRHLRRALAHCLDRLQQ